jgi:hypothetical protein
VGSWHAPPTKMAYSLDALTPDLLYSTLPGAKSIPQTYFSRALVHLILIN